jgi:hypothetical protein
MALQAGTVAVRKIRIEIPGDREGIFDYTPGGMPACRDSLPNDFAQGENFHFSSKPESKIVL